MPVLGVRQRTRSATRPFSQTAPVLNVRRKELHAFSQHVPQRSKAQAADDHFGQNSQRKKDVRHAKTTSGCVDAPTRTQSAITALNGDVYALSFQKTGKNISQL